MTIKVDDVDAAYEQAQRRSYEIVHLALKRRHERGDHLPQQIKTRLTQLLRQPAGLVDIW